MLVPICMRALVEHATQFVYQLNLEPGRSPVFIGFLHLQKKCRPTALVTKLAALPGLEVFAATIEEVGFIRRLMIPGTRGTRVGGPWASEEVYRGEDLPSELLPYQAEIRDYVLGPVDPREILWLVDYHGNTGKSIFAKYMYHHHGCLKLTWGDTGDILNVVFKMPARRCYIFDLSRTKPKTFSQQDLYAAIEDIKNGYIFNTKYETGVRVMNPPHVLVFANVPPDLRCLTGDRWNVRTIHPEWNPHRIAQRRFTFSDTLMASVPLEVEVESAGGEVVGASGDVEAEGAGGEVMASSGGPAEPELIVAFRDLIL